MKYFSFLKKYWWLFLVMLIAGFGASILEGLGVTLIIPIVKGPGAGEIAQMPAPFNQILKLFLDMTLAQRLKLAAILLIIISAIKGILLYINEVSSGKMMVTSEKHFRMLCFRQMMKTGMSYFTKQKGADIHTVCNLYVKNFGSLVNIIGLCLPKVFQIIVLFAIMVILSWKITLLSIVLLGIASLILRVLSYRIQAMGKRFAAANKTINAAIFDAILGMKVIRIFNRQGDTTDILEKEQDQLNDIHMRMVRIRAVVKPLFEFIGATCLGLIMIVWALFVLRSSQFGLQFLFAFIVIFYRISAPVMYLNHARVAIMGDFASYREVFNFLSSEGKNYLPNGKKEFKQLQNSIRFDEVTFNYDKGLPLVLKNASFTIDRGMKVGIVGSSGAGKSTITELVLRFYDPQQGRIIVDGLDLKELRINSWRKAIGIVSQDIFLFNTTVRENIAYAKLDASNEDVEFAAKKAHAGQFIKELPKGYDTLIGDRGVLLSGGQRQRLAIARAIINKPDILVFDEATSALDSESEKIVQEALDEVSQGRTVIAIAHRLSTVFDADLILVIDSGRIVEQGTHQELRDRGKVYKKLLEMQGYFNSSFSEPDTVKK